MRENKETLLAWARRTGRLPPGSRIQRLDHDPETEAMLTEAARRLRK